MNATLLIKQLFCAILKSPAIGTRRAHAPSLSIYRCVSWQLDCLAFMLLALGFSHVLLRWIAGDVRRKRVMKKNQILGLVLRCLQIANAFARLAEKLYVLWNMTNNYHRLNESKMVFEI
jgi:hypothetical protein